MTQTYSKIPKQLIRDNAYLQLVFKQDDTNLRHIYSEHVNKDIPWSQFKDLCSSIWKEPYQFFGINKDSAVKYGQYRKGFDNFLYLD